MFLGGEYPPPPQHTQFKNMKPICVSEDFEQRTFFDCMVIQNLLLHTFVID